MTTDDVAEDVAAMCRQGLFVESGEKYWAEEVISIEPGGARPISRGRAAVRAKGVWWSGSHQLHGHSVEGPWVNGDRFALRFVFDVTNKQSRQRMKVDEIALYTLRDGQIVEERFFYSGPNR
jgi:hypothetical protein